MDIGFIYLVLLLRYGADLWAWFFKIDNSCEIWSFVQCSLTVQYFSYKNNSDEWKFATVLEHDHYKTT